MENNFDCLLLASGGMDSTVLAYKLAKENKNVVILFIDYGQHCKTIWNYMSGKKSDGQLSIFDICGDVMT